MVLNETSGILLKKIKIEKLASNGVVSVVIGQYARNLDVVDNHKSFRLCLPSIRKDLSRRMRSPRSPVPRHGKDADIAGTQRFVELPRAASPFCHLPNYTDDDQEDTEDGAIASSGNAMLDCKNDSDNGSAAAG